MTVNIIEIFLGGKLEWKTKLSATVIVIMPSAAKHNLALVVRLAAAVKLVLLGSRLSNAFI